jgi:hypothetical protein
MIFHNGNRLHQGKKEENHFFRRFSRDGAGKMVNYYWMTLQVTNFSLPLPGADFYITGIVQFVQMQL